MTRAEILRRFPNAGESFIRRNLGAAPLPLAPAPVPQVIARAKLQQTKDETGLNKTERAFYEILKRRDLACVQPVAITLKLADNCRYTPDFFAIDKDGLITFFEVKGGWIMEDAIIKIKTAAREFRWARFVLAQFKKGQWTEKEMQP